MQQVYTGLDVQPARVSFIHEKEAMKNKREESCDWHQTRTQISILQLPPLMWTPKGTHQPADKLEVWDAPSKKKDHHFLGHLIIQ